MLNFNKSIYYRFNNQMISNFITIFPMGVYSVVGMYIVERNSAYYIYQDE